MSVTDAEKPLRAQAAKRYSVPMSSDGKNLEFEGRLSDGELSQSVPVVVTLELDGLMVKRPDRSKLTFWKFCNLRAAATIRASDRDIFLSNTQAPRATLLLEGTDVARDLLARAPQIAPNPRRARIMRIALIAAIALLAAGVFLFYGKGRYSKAIAQLIPNQAAYKLGQQSAEVFWRIGAACYREPGISALRKILTRLTSAGSYGRPFELHVAHSPMANVFALPGHHIMLLSGLIGQTKSPEELAGILAHEMGHALERDPEALFVRTIGVDSLAGLLTGNAGEENATGFSALLLQIRYSQEAERAADDHALAILRRAEIAPRPGGEFLLRHSVGSRPHGGSMQYLGTHPWSGDRAKPLLLPVDYPTKPILSDKDWADAQAVCGD